MLTACGPSLSDPAVVRVPCEGEPGAECVFNRRQDWTPGEGLSVSDRPSVTISRPGGEREVVGFGAITGLTRLPDGTIVVADGMTRRVHFFDADGGWRSGHGRRGEGPGEYLGLGWLDRCWADRLAARDRQFLVEVALDGEWIGRRGLIDVFGQRPMFLACDGAGHFLGLGIDAAAWRGRTSDGILRPDGEAVLAESDSGRRVTLGRFPVTEFHQRLSDFGFHPLARVTQLAVGGGWAWVGTSDRFMIEQFDMEGRLRRRVEREWQLQELDAERVGELLDRALEELAPQAREFWRGRLGPDDNPPSLPAYDALLVDDEGRLWARQYELPGESANRWSVFNGSGRWLGDVNLPVRFEPFEISSGTVLGVALGVLDEATIALYELRSGEGGA